MGLDIKKYLEQLLTITGGTSAPLEVQFLNKHGHSMVPKKHPKRGTMAAGECYANAYALASSETAYRYCEGYATTKKLGIALPHAWVVDRDLKVIDPTWVDGDQYFGVMFSPFFVYKVVAKTKYYGILGNHHKLKMLPHDTLLYFENGLQRLVPKA